MTTRIVNKLKSALCFAGFHNYELTAKWADENYTIVLSEYVCSICNKRHIYVELFEPKRCSWLFRHKVQGDIQQDPLMIALTKSTKDSENVCDCESKKSRPRKTAKARSKKNTDSESV